MEKKKQMRSQRDLQYKKTRNTDKVREASKVEATHTRGVGRPKGSRNKVRVVVATWPEGLIFPPQRYTQEEKDQIAKAKERLAKKQTDAPTIDFRKESRDAMRRHNAKIAKQLSKEREESYMKSVVSDWNIRTMWYLLGILSGGFVVYAMARLALVGGLK